jgi:hypothetical protein
MSGGKGGGGGVDITPMVNATNRGIDLQKEIYDKNTELAQPWYQTGVSGVGRLADLMGLSGGSVKSREQIAKELTPQYTATVANPQAAALYSDADGNQYSAMELADLARTGGLRGGTFDMSFEDVKKALAGADTFGSGEGSWLGGQRFWQATPAETQSVNYDALNAAIDERLAGQGELPDDYGSLTKKFGMEDFQADPSYAFRQAEGNKAIERAMAAAGKTLDPRAAKALMGFNQDLASTEYGNAYNRYNNDQTNLFNRLAAISGFGQTSSGQLMGAGTNYANSVNELTSNLANAQVAASNQGGGGSLFGGLADLGSAAYGLGKGYGALKAAGFFSDARLKTGIKKVGTVKGVNVYEYAYKWEPSLRYRGVMAQEILESHPEAVGVCEGFLCVDYGQLPVKMERVCQ